MLKNNRSPSWRIADIFSDGIMVRCILQGKLYETCVEETTRDLPMGKGVLKCMMNGVIYYPGMENVLEAEALRELTAAYRATKIIEDHFDHLGRPRLKIIYVDLGAVFADTPSEATELADKHIETIIKAEKEKERRDGIPMPRLIFVKQDRDYWPGSEKDPEVMVRRAAKELKARPCYPDYKEIYVPPSPEEEKPWPSFFADKKTREAFLDRMYKLNFMSYYDPSLPGTKFILDNLRPNQASAVINEYMRDPDLWKQWIALSQLDKIRTSNMDSQKLVDDGCSTWLNQDCQTLVDGVLLG